MIVGQVPVEASPTKATTGVEQLSASSVTTVISGAGTLAIHCTVTGAGLEAVGKISSFTVMVCVTVIELPLLLFMLRLPAISTRERSAAASHVNTRQGVEQLSASSVTTVI